MKNYQYVVNISLFILLLFLVAQLFMLLWNTCLVGTIEGINTINIIKSIGILALFALLIVGAIILFTLFTYDASKNIDS